MTTAPSSEATTPCLVGKVYGIGRQGSMRWVFANIFVKRLGFRALAIILIARSARTAASLSQQLSTAPWRTVAALVQTIHDAGSRIRRGRFSSA